MIKEHLIKYGSITIREAQEHYCVGRLSEVIGKLRRKGYTIHTVMKKGINKFGKTYEYGIYVWDKCANRSMEDEQQE